MIVYFEVLLQLVLQMKKSSPKERMLPVLLAHVLQ
jgi:hypothetical protein